MGVERMRQWERWGVRKRKERQRKARGVMQKGGGKRQVRKERGR